MKSLFFVIFSFLLSSCTLSFQNISTHGTANDLVDENLSPNNNFTPTVITPVGGL